MHFVLTRLVLVVVFATCICAFHQPRACSSYGWKKELAKQQQQQLHEEQQQQQLQQQQVSFNKKVENRREFMKFSVLAGISSAFIASSCYSPMVAYAGLLDDFGSDPSRIEQKPPPEPERPAVSKKGENAIDPSLRASYYYPTAKKRYLPRIQKVTDEIETVPESIFNDDWGAVEAFSVKAENAILPLQLYVSSLDGQGLGMSNSYAKTMKQDARRFEEYYKVLQKAMKAKDKELAFESVKEMGIAVADYRQAGRLTSDDGNIPSVDDIKRMSMRRPTAKFNN